jgi:hypothetical protein
VYLLAYHSVSSICASIHLQPFYEDTPDAMKNHAITSVRAIKAADITSRLNLRIRLPYVCVQLISRTLTGVRLLVSINSVLICEKVSACFIRLSHTFFDGLTLPLGMAKDGLKQTFGSNS